uniref:[heparan sulfate]-glucosamine N-sulfotransferase n=1 Tax=Angiostrongylus cantonensis TaxID=6313 RepID=A0A0K0D1D7_ANGCA
MLPYYSRRLLKFFKLALVLAFAVSFLLICRLLLKPDISARRYPPQRLPFYECPCNTSVTQTTQPSFVFRNLTEHRALILLESTSSRHGRLLQQILSSSRYPFRTETFTKNFPSLTATTLRGRYAVIIIENYYKYLNMAKWSRQLLDKYCVDYKVPLISFLFTRPNITYKKVKIKDSMLYFWQNQEVSSLKVADSSIHRISRIGAERTNVNTQDWVLFEESPASKVLSARDVLGRPRAAVLHDKGEVDNVERVLFGYNVTDWMMKMTFLDVLWYTTGGRIGWSLDRYVQIDIDDIFVGARGTRMVEDDVTALLASQKHLRQYISNFTYMLGFSGSYFHNGDDNEDRGDERLVELAQHFIWFPHMWRHNHAHEHNLTYLEATMVQNFMFAENMQLPVKYPYAIAPQHDGVYPIHTDLYNAWKKVWKVEVTATEEYPHFKPASSRRGFVYMNVSVLPRQTCGLYTHTQFFHNYPGGFSKLTSLIYGGELFFTVLLNPISIFMTHQQNFAHDRLASYTFDNLVRFIRCWTNIRLRWQSPVESSQMYFSLMPQEKDPIWSNPCEDPRHKIILPPSLNCSTLIFPNALIVGPQKTGTSALAMFLSLHPNVSTNAPIPGSFEELQFFGGSNYHKGIEWYSRQFTNAHTVLEKSATYFDNVNAPMEAHALVPEAKIVVLLYDPARRAYSWYQHMLAHNETSVVMAGSMETVLDAETPQLKKIRQRCISGGRYTYHFDRWLELYPMSNLIFIDGERFREDPVTVLTELALKLGLPYFDFERAIRFSPSKGFFCQVHNGKPKCLGRSKGRAYPPMSHTLWSRLNGIFAADNIALHNFLIRNHLPVPVWLERVRFTPTT